ncbi:MAG: uncharacterized membrane protein (UPF0127 family) [Myxococcota bacterium]|jgi:uncharacterized membrane protein (UPF0127 family)
MQRLLLTVLAATLVGSFTGCEPTPWPETELTVSPLERLSARITFQQPEGTVVAEATVVSTDAERAVGLMYRKERLADGEGMLFAMDKDADHSFWMKNTYIPLDMLFIDQSGVVVGILQDVTPRTKTARRVGLISRFVLELDAGYCARHKVTVGQRVEMVIHSS